MLFIGENRIVGHEIVLFQERFSVSDLHIQKRIAQTENLVRHGEQEENECAGTSAEKCVRSRLRLKEILVVRVANQLYATNSHHGRRESLQYMPR